MAGVWSNCNVALPQMAQRAENGLFPVQTLIRLSPHLAYVGVTLSPSNRGAIHGRLPAPRYGCYVIASSVTLDPRILSLPLL